jgi:RNA polymerase sigma-70 factor (ECF subfamily)
METSNQLEPDEIHAAIHRIKAGDSELFWSLVMPYQRSLQVTAYSLLRNVDDAAEVVQETMLKALQSLDRLREEKSFKGWLHKIAINEARMRLRKNRGEVSPDNNTADDEGFYRPRDYAEWREIPSDALERKEIWDAVQRALKSLSPSLQEVFTLRDIQHFSVPETAQILGISEAQVSVRLHRARLQMRDFLAPLFRKYPSPWMPIQMMPDMPAMLIHRVVRCKTVVKEISNYIEELLGATLRDQIEEHLKYCRRCRILLDTTKKVMYLVADEMVLLPPLSYKGKSAGVD